MGDSRVWSARGCIHNSYLLCFSPWNQTRYKISGQIKNTTFMSYRVLHASIPKSIHGGFLAQFKKLKTSTRLSHIHVDRWFRRKCQDTKLFQPLRNAKFTRRSWWSILTLTMNSEAPEMLKTITFFLSFRQVSQRYIPFLPLGLFPFLGGVAFWGSVLLALPSS